MKAMESYQEGKIDALWCALLYLRHEVISDRDNMKEIRMQDQKEDEETATNQANKILKQEAFSELEKMFKFDVNLFQAAYYIFAIYDL